MKKSTQRTKAHIPKLVDFFATRVSLFIVKRIFPISSNYLESCFEIRIFFLFILHKCSFFHFCISRMNIQSVRFEFQESIGHRALDFDADWVRIVFFFLLLFLTELPSANHGHLSVRIVKPGFLCLGLILVQDIRKESKKIFCRTKKCADVHRQ